MRSLWRKPVEDIVACLSRLAEARRPMRSLLVAVIALVVTWFLYVPVHELLHAAGCRATGGSVTRLEIAPQYGGPLLARWFPFVVSGSDYAGRLSGFDTRGSDLVYLATDFAPYLLTVLIGVPLMRWCTRHRRPVSFGVAVVVGLAPFYNIFGDYYEMGSIVTTRVVTIAGAEVDDRRQADAGLQAAPIESFGADSAFSGIRSDDLFRLIGDLVSRPSDLRIHGAGKMAAAIGLVLVSLVAGLVLACLTYRLGDFVAVATVGTGGRNAERGVQK